MFLKNREKFASSHAGEIPDSLIKPKIDMRFFVDSDVWSIDMEVLIFNQSNKNISNASNPWNIQIDDRICRQHSLFKTYGIISFHNSSRLVDNFLNNRKLFGSIDSCPVFSQQFFIEMICLDS